MKPIKAPAPDRQVTFHSLLVTARQAWLMDALSGALGQVDPAGVSEGLSQYAPAAARKILAAAGLRDEHVFPTPSILKAKPTLVGYYRLLLGSPRKTFYASATGMSQIQSMETRGTLTAEQEAILPAFCQEMGKVLGDLVAQLSPTVTRQDLLELPILTLGQQFQGGRNNTIGKEATDGVFRSINAYLDQLITSRAAGKITTGHCTIALGSDPDIRVEERTATGLIRKVAMEIKGGADTSNEHNRAGEAEKSHIHAAQAGYPERWTIIHMKGRDIAKIKSHSPSATAWFDAAEILAQQGPDWDDFCQRLSQEIGPI